MRQKIATISKIERLILLVVLLDIFFFPYLFHLPIKISMVILAFYPLLTKKRYEYRILSNTAFFVVIGFFSIIVGFLKDEPRTEFILSSVQSLIIIIYGYWVYEYFKAIINKTKFDLTPFFLLYLLIAILFAAIYWIRPSLFFSIRPFWTLQRTGETFVDYSINRFSFLMSEPNNFASSVNGIMAFLLLGNRITKKEKIVVACISLLLILSAQSISGTIVFAAILVLSLVFVRKNKCVVPASRFRTLITSIFSLFAVMAIIYVLININTILKLDLVQSATSRYDLYFNERGNDFTGKRKDVWISMIQTHEFYKYIFFGDASAGKTHSGHLFILYGFGLLFLFNFLRLFLFDNLKTKRAVILRLIFLIVFSTNTLIVDLRAFTMWAMLLAITYLEKIDYRIKKYERRSYFDNRSHL